jgi:hypothetical protein
VKERISDFQVERYVGNARTDGEEDRANDDPAIDRLGGVGRKQEVGSP